MMIPKRAPMTAMVLNASPRWLRFATGLVLAASLGGCSLFSSKPTRQVPATLTAIQSQVQLSEVWSLDLGRSTDGDFSVQPFADDIVAARPDGAVWRIDAHTGAVLWRTKTATPLSTGPGADERLIAVVGRKGEVYAFSQAGELLWRESVQGEVLSRPLVAQGLVLVRTVDQRVIALDGHTGRRRWVYQRPSAPLALRGAQSLVADAYSVYAGFAGGKVAALNIATGVVRWESQVSRPRGVSEIERLNDVTGPLALLDDRLCAASFQGGVACLMKETGQPLWANSVSAPVGVSSDGERIFVPTENGELRAYDAVNGQLLWTQSALTWRQLSTPAVIGRFVLVGDFESQLHVLSRNEGGFAGRLRVGGDGLAGQPMRIGDVVVVQARSGRLSAIKAD
jgi:outer membrane protein assembly factor BamB